MKNLNLSQPLIFTPFDEYKIIIDYRGVVGAGKFEYIVDKKTYNKIKRNMNMLEDFVVEKKYFDFKFVKKVDFICNTGMAVSKETIFNRTYFNSSSTFVKVQEEVENSIGEHFNKLRGGKEK